MVRYVRVSCALWLAIVSVVPSHHIDLAAHEESEPESVGLVYLLLVKLGIGVEKDYSWKINVLRRLCLHLWHQLDLLVIVREKHAIDFHPVLRLDHERSAIEIFYKHLLQLIVWMKQIGINHVTAVTSAAPIVKRVVGLLDNGSELDHQVFKLRQQLVV